MLLYAPFIACACVSAPVYIVHACAFVCGYVCVRMRGAEILTCLPVATFKIFPIVLEYHHEDHEQRHVDNRLVSDHHLPWRVTKKLTEELG